MTSTSTPNERQVGGAHYAAGLQHWDLVATARMGYFEGQISKYISRHGKKNKLQDVEKAFHFAEKLAELYAHQLAPAAFGRVSPTAEAVLLEKFCDRQDMSPNERRVIALCIKWRNSGDLGELMATIQAVRLQFYGI